MFVERGKSPLELSLTGLSTQLLFLDGRNTRIHAISVGPLPMRRCKPQETGCAWVVELHGILHESQMSSIRGLACLPVTTSLTPPPHQGGQVLGDRPSVQRTS